MVENSSIRLFIELLKSGLLGFPHFFDTCLFTKILQT